MLTLVGKRQFVLVDLSPCNDTACDKLGLDHITDF